MKIYYVANARIPSEKAHGIQIAKMSEALIEAGADLTLILPRRTHTPESLQSYYGLRVPIKTEYLPVVDWYSHGRIGFFVSSLSFMYASFFCIRAAKKRGEEFQIYSVDMDTFSYTVLPVLGPTTIEMHSPKKKSYANRFFFKRVRLVVATNSLIAEALRTTFNLKDGKIIVAPNGFDIHTERISKEVARAQLALPTNIRIALYVGRALSWKGMEILPHALQHLPEDVRCYLVGVNEQELTKISGGRIPRQVVAVGERPSHEIPTWLAAAEIGIVLGTKENESSFKYTSPMKIFEYIGAGLPVVASNTPALADVVSEEDVFFYTPDDPISLEAVVQEALASDERAQRKAQHASALSEHYSWPHRAKRVLETLTKGAT